MKFICRKKIQLLKASIENLYQDSQIIPSQMLKL